MNKVWIGLNEVPLGRTNFYAFGKTSLYEWPRFLTSGEWEKVGESRFLLASKYPLVLGMLGKMDANGDST